MAHNPPAPEPQVTTRKLIAFSALVFGMFMAILDIQIVSSSLSEIQAGLSASAEEISWVQTSYLIAEVIMIPLSGFLARALSTRILFSASAAGFTLASILCATATTLPEMIGYRAIQGFIGGGMIPTAFAAAYTIFPKRAQAPVMAVVGLTVTLAPTIGPTVGGYLTDLFSWHWLFLVNIVPGTIATLIAWNLVDFDKPEFGLLKHFDYIGLASMAIFLGSLEFLLEEGSSENWFESNEIRLFALLTAIGGAIFFFRAFTRDVPLVDLSAFKDRNFAVGSLFTFILGIGLYGLTYLYPLYLARVRGYNALEIGETVFVTGVFMFLAAPVVGILGRKLDPRLVISCGLIGFAISSFELAPLTKDWSFWELFLPQALRGVSLMMCMVPINILALGTLPPDRIKNASGLFNLMRNIGGAFGLAGITTILNDRWDLHLTRLHDSVSWGRDVAVERLNTMALGLQGALDSNADLAAVQQLAQIVRREALVMAFADVFLIMGLIFAVMVLLIPLVSKPRAEAGDAPAH
ncbi:MFS transporter [Agaricicola taiwanensis]|uniref:MFS transporter n=1 Tax=Agaricicola taiwanensis TaxID=591372 RepID=A0A8J2VK60_9RHOB|nr:DHA2 family efflux MFS transporter permease subunit [Agaricicola taiwanensis]GGE33891.1 MFS transporter [Agaricicola taiwanensis]